VRTVLDPEAKAELREAALFYEECREGLGRDFLNAADEGLASIRRHPKVWRRIRGRFRRCIMHRFPYAIIYAVEPECIYVAAVMHMKRKPTYWSGRGKRAT
jgi:toxin ParE1/3/4